MRYVCYGAMASSENAPDPKRRQSTYRSLLQSDEAALYRDLSDPQRWDPEEIMYAAIRGGGRSRVRTPVEIWRDRKRRLKEHRRAAQELRRFAEKMQDAERRLAFEQAAQVHDAFVQTLEAVACESLEDGRSAHERWLACEHEVEELERERRLLDLQRRSTWQRLLHRSVANEFREIDQRLETLRKEKAEFAVLDEQEAERARPHCRPAAQYFVGKGPATDLKPGRQNFLMPIFTTRVATVAAGTAVPSVMRTSPIAIASAVSS
jgi:hypothetical protein